MKNIFLLLCVVGLLFGCASGDVGVRKKSLLNEQQAQATQQPQANASFVGEWIISNFTERGTLTMKHDGKIFKISERNGVYEMDGPDWVFEYAKFRLVRSNALSGSYVANYDDLKEMFSNFPDGVLVSAANSKSVIYTGQLVMQRDGRIVADRSNNQITYSVDGRFSHATQLHQWYKFTLTRKP